MICGASLLAFAPTRVPGGKGLAWFSVAVTDDELLAVVHEAVDAVVASFDGHDDWGLSGGRDGQYASDLVADSAALSVLQNAGLAVLSEESGRSSDAELVAVVDPLDGSTNASRPLPWFATSICVVEGDRPRVAVVHDHTSGVRWDAIAGGGARVDGAPLPRRAPVPLDEAIVAINALPSRNPGWGQFRCFGAAALDLCAVADGRFDAYVDFDVDAEVDVNSMTVISACPAMHYGVDIDVDVDVNDLRFEFDFDVLGLTIVISIYRILFQV